MCLWPDILQASVLQSIMKFSYFILLSGPEDTENMIKMDKNFIPTRVRDSRAALRACDLKNTLER